MILFPCGTERPAKGDGLVAAPVTGVTTGEDTLINGWSLAATCWARFAYANMDMFAAAP
jgi:hypothetical protein